MVGFCVCVQLRINFFPTAWSGMSTANRELQEMQDLLGRLPEQPEDAVTTEELQQFKELLTFVGQ